ncbi:MAG: hypothetical protein R2879_14745 [Saprospiraceae bacterium]
MNKSLFIAATFLFFCHISLFAQHINLNNQSPVTHMLDRWAIKYGVNEDMHINLRPNLRSEAVVQAKKLLEKIPFYCRVEIWKTFNTSLTTTMNGWLTMDYPKRLQESNLMVVWP